VVLRFVLSPPGVKVEVLPGSGATGKDDGFHVKSGTCLASAR
jgi:hypothetical protein